MNNSFIASGEVQRAINDTTPQVEKEAFREAFLVRMLEAIEDIQKTSAWKVLRKEIFDEKIESLERRLMIEAEKFPIDDKEIYRLQGQLISAKKYGLNDLQKTFKVELENLRKRNNENK